MAKHNIFGVMSRSVFALFRSLVNFNYTIIIAAESLSKYSSTAIASLDCTLGVSLVVIKLSNVR